MAENIFACPWCTKGEVYSEGRGRVSVTVRCPKCLHFYRIRLDTYSVERVQARRRTPNKLYRSYGCSPASNGLRR